jgi:hypothetical protein
MADFNPDSADRKQVLHSLTAKHQRIVNILNNSEPRGFVTWDVSSGRTEKDFYLALQTGLSFLRTDCTDEWCVLGNGVFAIIRGMDIFQELETVEIACGLIYVGNIRRMRIYLRPWPDQPSVEFYIGHRNECVKALAMNFPWGFADEQPQHDQMINPNMGVEPAVDRDYEDAVHREYEAAAAAVQRDRERQAKEEAASPLWRALLGAFTNEDGRGNPF